MDFSKVHHIAIIGTDFEEIKTNCREKECRDRNGEFSAGHS